MEANNTLEETMHFSNLVELLRWRAEHQPDYHAYTWLADGETQEVCVTHRQLDEQARAIAVWLQSHGTPGARVLLVIPSGLEVIAAFMGCLYAGMVGVLAYPPQRNRPLTHLMATAEDAQATLALTTTQIQSDFRDQFDQAPTFPRQLLAIDDLTGINADDWRKPALTGDTLAMLMYTSGSTGTPKGVMLSHSHLAYNQPRIWQALDLTSEDVAVSWAPLYHVAGLGGALAALSLGTRLILMPSSAVLERPARWLQAMTRYKCTASFGFNFAFQMCIDRITSAERATLDLSHCKWIMTGGEQIHAEILERFAETFAPCGFRRQALLPLYGLSEASGSGTGLPSSAGLSYCTVQRSALERNQVIQVAPGDKTGKTFVICGHALPEKRIVIVDPESLTQCLPDRVGEIWISDPTVAQGYWNRPEETKRTFQATLADTGEGPFLRTGDLGFMVDGELVITGRLKDLIIIRGHNLYPYDIEATVEKSHLALQPNGGAAFSVAVEGTEQLVIVHEIKRDSELPDADEVVRAIRRAVATEQEQPVYVVALVKAGTLPRTESGKIQRFLARSQFESGELNALKVSRLDAMQPAITTEKPGYVAPRSPIERALVGIWSGVLGVAQIGVNDNFFELGGDSIKATQVISQVKDVFQVELDLRAPFDSPTIANLAAEIVKARQQSS